MSGEKMDSKPIAVFGASGFLGRHVVEKLAADDNSVRAIARSRLPSSAPSVVSLSLDVATASTVDIAEAIRGCAAVVNLVGIKRESSSQTFSALHVRFVERLLEAMGKADVSRLVHVSVVSARPDARSAYHDTKWQAEERIRASGVAYTILRPGVIYGQGDDLLGHLTKMIRASSVFPIVGNGLTEQQPLDVADDAAAIASSLRTPLATRKVYEVVGPKRLTLRDIVGRVGRALGLKVRIVPTSLALMRPAVHVMNRFMESPLSTPAQLQMLIDGMTGDPEPMRRDLGVDPQPFTVERIRATARECEARLPFDLRLSNKSDDQESSKRGLWTMAVIGIIVMNVVFLLPTRDTWTRVVAGIVVLGAIGAHSVWRRRRSLLRVDSLSVALGIASGLGLYAVARWMTRLPAIAVETAKVSTWRDGHSPGVILVTLILAVLSEELFWRGTITRLLVARLPKWSAAVVATLIFSVAHIGSGSWLLPVAGAGIVLAWNLLYLVTGSLVAPIFSHLTFDLLAMLVVPLTLTS
jgi:NADH dehydrogenase